MMDKALRASPAGLLAFAIATGTALAGAPPPPVPPTSVNPVLIQRLRTVGRIWGEVKYRHPWLYYEGVDWDRALFDALPKTRAAQDDNAFETAVGEMLADLDDPLTHVEMSASASTEAVAPQTTHTNAVWRTEERALVVDCAELAASGMAWPDEVLKDPALDAALATSQGVVFDCRLEDLASDPRIRAVSRFLGSVAAAFADGPTLTTATRRFRELSGVPPQTSPAGALYRSAMVVESPAAQRVLPHPTSAGKPVAIVLDQPLWFELLTLVGLQSTGQLRVVQQGADVQVDEYVSTALIEFSATLRVRIRTSELVYPDGRVGFTADRVVGAPDGQPAGRAGDPALMAALEALREPSAAPTAIGAVGIIPLRSTSDEAYRAMNSGADADLRLLALFRIWHAIDKLYPYKDLIDTSWSEALPRYIARMEQVRSRRGYEETLLELLAETDDAHAVLMPRREVMPARRSYFVPPIRLAHVEGRVRVVQASGSDSELLLGAEVLAADGVPVDEWVARLSRYIPQPTPGSLFSPGSPLFLEMIGGDRDTAVELRVLTKGTRARTVRLTRTELYAPPWQSGPLVQVFDGNVGYLDLRRLTPQSLGSAISQIERTQALVIDLRGYPAAPIGPLVDRVSRLTETTTAIRNLIPIYDARTGRVAAHLDVSLLAHPATSTPYPGRIFVLINADAFSAAETYCVLLDAAADVTFVGTPTQGTNGSITSIIVPGGMVARFSGMNTSYADGRRLQRRGVQPDVSVPLTPNGVQAGRDELLEKALALAREASRP